MTILAEMQLSRVRRVRKGKANHRIRVSKLCSKRAVFTVRIYSRRVNAKRISVAIKPTVLLLPSTFDSSR